MVEVTGTESLTIEAEDNIMPLLETTVSNGRLRLDTNRMTASLAGRPVDDDGMVELLQPWRPHRYRVVRLIELSPAAKPRFGPRLTIQDHRSH